MPPEHYEAAVARAVERIRAGDAREGRAGPRGAGARAAPHDAAARVRRAARGVPGLLRVLRRRAAERAFMAATPELLVRREGQRATTVALAGSTRRSADPAVDDHLGEQLLRSDKDREEQAIVARRIERALRPHAVWVAAAPEPDARAGRQHPAPGARRSAPSWPRRARRSSSPACCTRRRRSAASRCSARAPLIPALEGLDRGWYAGPVGWTDATERRRVLRRPALRAAARQRGALLRRRRRRARLRPGVGAGRDRDQAAGAAAGPHLTRRHTPTTSRTVARR